MALQDFGLPTIGVGVVLYIAPAPLGVMYRERGTEKKGGQTWMHAWVWCAWRRKMAEGNDVYLQEMGKEETIDT